MKRASLVFALMMTSFGCATPPPPAVPAPPPPRHVTVLLSVDALRPVDLDDTTLKIPALRALMDRGARAKSAITVWPSVTYPAHATMVTGAVPREHGIVANGPFDPDFLNDGGWFWYAESIRVKTLWQAAKEHGLRTGNVYWPTTVGALFDWSFPQFWRQKIAEDEKLLRALASPPGLVDELRAKWKTVPVEHRNDAARMDAAVFLLEEKHPDFLLVYLTDLDTVRHHYGPESAEARATLEGIDTQIGRLVAATHDPSFAHTTLVVTSDHGFLPVSQVVRPLVYFKEQGLVDFDFGRDRMVSRAVGVSTSGGLASVIVLDPAQTEKVATAVAALAADPKYGIEHVYDAAHMTAVGGGFPEATWTLETKPGFMFDGGIRGEAVEATGYKGTHGWPPELPAMRAIFVAAGCGVQRGKTVGDVSLLDVAPTVARILGVPWAKGRGRALDEILDPSQSCGAR